jgi:hypothetical protein
MLCARSDRASLHQTAFLHMWSCSWRCHPVVSATMAVVWVCFSQQGSSQDQCTGCVSHHTCIPHQWHIASSDQCMPERGFISSATSCSVKAAYSDRSLHVADRTMLPSSLCLPAAPILRWACGGCRMHRMPCVGTGRWLAKDTSVYRFSSALHYVARKAYLVPCVYHSYSCAVAGCLPLGSLQVVVRACQAAASSAGAEMWRMRLDVRIVAQVCFIRCRMSPVEPMHMRTLEQHNIHCALCLGAQHTVRLLKAVY